MVGMLQRWFHAAVGFVGLGHPELGEVTWTGGYRMPQILWKRGSPVVLSLAVQRVLEQAGKKGRESALPAFAAGLAELSSTCF